jgi:hypothetical protein
MSFDLCILGSDVPLTYDAALAIYFKLCAGDQIRTKALSSVEAFGKELDKLYPDIDSLPESEIDASPWSSGHDRSVSHLIVAIRWNRVEELEPIITRLARKHGLYCLDPQNRVLHDW